MKPLYLMNSQTGGGGGSLGCSRAACYRYSCRAESTWRPRPVITFPSGIGCGISQSCNQIQQNRFLASFSIKSDFRDFQDYARPTQLLPTTEVKRFTVASPEKIAPCSEVTDSESLYKITLSTSSAYGSDLSNLNSGVLVCIIDEYGNSILQRIPSTSHENNFAGSDDGTASETFHFQRGSVDEFLFTGPELGRVQAIWVSVESGRWRLGEAVLTVVSRSKHHEPQPTESASQFTSIQYDFEADDIMLGEQSETTMVELRPSQITECSGINPSLLLNRSMRQPEALADKGITKEESMREYANLKFSLLMYDAMLVSAGASVASLSGESTALAFLTGGIGGFLFLLLLQRSVDRLPAPDRIASSKGSNNETFGELKGPLLVLAFASGFAVLVAKRGSLVDVELVMTHKELVFGVMGFLMCKVAVVLAAFKPLSITLKEGN